MLTDEQKKRATQAFDDLDEEGSGTIPNTKETLLKAAQLSGLNPTDEEIERHMESVADAGETLDKDRFVAFMELLEWKSKDEIKEELQADFQYFDKDNSGALDQTELTAILTQYGVEGLPEEEVKELIATFDKDGDEKISIEELVELLIATV